MLDTAELVAARADANKLLPSLCTIRAYSHAIDAGGGQTETYTAGSQLACRLAPVGGGEGSSPGARISERTTHVLTLAAETVIEESAQVDVVGVGRFEVTAVRKRPQLEIVRRVELREAG